MVYGGICAPRATGIATTRSSETLKTLEEDETLLVQSGKPVGVFKTHSNAPRADRQLQPSAPTGQPGNTSNELDARPGHVRPDDRRSWIYIGSQGIVQGT